MFARRIGHRLAHRHRDVEEELVVAADEVEAAGKLRVVLGGASQRRRQQAQQQRRAGDVALVHLVAHGQAARDQRLQRDAAHFPQGAPNRRPEAVAQPGEAGQHLGVVAAEPHHLAEAFVDGAVARDCRRRGSRPPSAAGSPWSCRSSGRRRRSDGWDGTRRRRSPPCARHRRGRPPTPRTRRCPLPRRASARTCGSSRSAARRAGSSGRSSAPGSPRRPAPRRPGQDRRTGCAARLPRWRFRSVSWLNTFAILAVSLAGYVPTAVIPAKAGTHDRRLRLQCQMLEGMVQHRAISSIIGLAGTCRGSRPSPG